MQMEYGSAAVLDFLTHAGERGMLPAATASALAVACRTVFEILEPGEAADLRGVDLERLVSRFVNKRARDFNPASLKEYGRRVKRAWDLFSSWKKDPANFSPKTRATAPKQGVGTVDRSNAQPRTTPVSGIAATSPAAVEHDDGYSSAFPIRRGRVVTISNLPTDLTGDEAERLAAFVRLLGAVQ
jgi:hypothetical protein